MRAEVLWELFQATGSPEAYLMYQEAKEQVASYR